MFPTPAVAFLALVAQAALLAATHWHPERENWKFVKRVAIGATVVNGCYTAFALLTLPMSPGDLFALWAFWGIGGATTAALYRDDVRLALRRIQRARRGREARRAESR